MHLEQQSIIIILSISLKIVLEIVYSYGYIIKFKLLKSSLYFKKDHLLKPNQLSDVFSFNAMKYCQINNWYIKNS